ncbi:6548_t:CDS:2, partial [Entrophospora sp. SA101]
NTKIFPDDIFARIALNPTLRPYLDQPDYVEKIKAIQANSELLNVHLQDKRITSTFMYILTGNANFDPKEPTSPTQREFEEAIKHYDKAWELDPTNIAILNNKAAVLFEQGKYEECIKICHEAIEIGQAIKYFNKSLTEHRTPEILGKLRDTEKLKVKKEKESYFNPELSDKAREAGNELFKKSAFADADFSFLFYIHTVEIFTQHSCQLKNMSSSKSVYLSIIIFFLKSVLKILVKLADSPN